VKKSRKEQGLGKLQFFIEKLIFGVGRIEGELIWCAVKLTPLTNDC